MTREEAIEIVKKHGISADGTKFESALSELIPELAESEDERIRKALVWHLKADVDFVSNGVTKAECIAYLEKQKENPKSADSISSDCTSDVKCEDRWHKVTDSLPDNGRLVLAKDCLGNVLLARYDGENWEVNVYDNEDHYCHNSISKWCEIPSEKQQESLHIPETSKENANSFTDEDERFRRWLCDYFSSIDKAWIHKDITCIDILRWLEKQKEQKPAEWSEEDERMIGRMRSVVNECAFYNDALDVNGDYCEGDYAKLDDWLKSLPLNLKKKNEDVAKLCSKEWSVEDEDRIRQIERIAQQAGCTQKLQEEIHNWLKSLRPSWKPSEEQMEALLNALHPDDPYYPELKSLYEQLKKLM